MAPIKNPVDLAKLAATEYQTIYGSDLVAGIVYGSAAGADFDPEKSDINLLIVLKEMNLESLRKSFSLQEKLHKKRFAQPLIMDAAYIASSLDSFPIEFLNIKLNCKLIFGADLPASWQVRPVDIRLQCERELKGKWLHLMHEWLHVNNNPARQLSLAQISLKDFAAIFRALLFLKGSPVPSNIIELLGAIEQAYSLVGKPLTQVQKTCLTNDKKQISAQFIQYTSAIKTIIDTIDQQSTKESV